MKKVMISMFSLSLLFIMSNSVIAETNLEISSNERDELKIEPRGMVIDGYEVILSFGWWEGLPTSYYYETTMSGKKFAGTLYLVKNIVTPNPSPDTYMGLYRGDLYQIY